MKRQKQSSKAEYLKKYDKSMQPLSSLGSGLVGKALLALLFVAILMFANIVLKKSSQEKYWFGWFRRALRV